MKLKVSIDIQAPVQKVYEVFTDIEAAENRIKKIEKIEIVESTDDFIGTRWEETRTEFGKTDTIEMWVTDATPNKSYRVESMAHGTKYTSTYNFDEQTDGVTTVSMEFIGEPQTIGAKVMSVMMIFFAGPTKKLFLKDMEDLKSYLESNR